MVDNHQRFITLDGISIPVAISNAEYGQIIDVIGKSRISKLQEQYELLCNLLNVTGIYTTSRINAIAKILIKNCSITSVTDYLVSRDTNGISLEDVVNIGNYKTTFNNIGIDIRIIEELYNTTFTGRSIMGRGEILINTLIKQATKPLDRGDIVINNIKYDVKIEKARFRGQKGFNNGSAVSVYLEKVLKSYAYDIDIPKGGSNAYHPTTRRVGVYFDIVKDLISSQRMDVQQAVNGYKNALLQAYTNIDKQYLQFVDDYFVSYDDKIIQRELPIALAKYYFDVEQLNDGGVICLNDAGTIKHMTKNNIHTFKLRCPSFGNSASTQGSAAMLHSV